LIKTRDNPATPLSEPLRAILQEADRTILGMAGGSHYLLYSYLRRTAARVARTDSFYIGFCRDDRTIVFPYNYDGREYDDPNVNAWVPGGLTEWIVQNKRAYWSRQDNGALLHRGRAFGDTARRSREGITAPLLQREASGRGQKVIGVISLLSYQEGVYTEETVRFLECLADSLATALRREEEDRQRRQRIGLPLSANGAAPDAAGIADALSGRLRRLRRKAESVRAAVPEHSPLRDAADDLCAECEQCQTEAMELLLLREAPVPGLPTRNPLHLLTAREREVALLLAAGYTNREVGDRLYISEKTAKTHGANILRKLGVTGRSGVAVLLRPYLPAPESTPME
jgi:DNA-binding CsgD family transcriptional regulator/GAF domain-containing protein